MSGTTQQEAPWAALAVGALIAAFGVSMSWISRASVGFCADSDIPGRSVCGDFTSSRYAVIGTVVLAVLVLGLFAATFYAHPPQRRILLGIALAAIVVVSLATPVANVTLPIPDIPEDFYP